MFRRKLSSSTTGASGNGHVDIEADLASPAQDVLNDVYSSVVNITLSPTVRGQPAGGVGSGIVYTADGCIMTNNHVATLDGAVTSGKSIVVTFSSGEQAPGTAVGREETRDLAANQG